MPAPPSVEHDLGPRLVAHGAIKKLIFFIVGAAVVVAVATYLEPFGQEYEVKTAIRLSCNDRFKNTRWGVPPLEDIDRDFNEKLHRARLRLNRDQWDFTSTWDKAAGTLQCEGRVKYNTETELWGVATFAPELPKLKLKHFVKGRTEINEKW